jgi:hypothetical protein
MTGATSVRSVADQFMTILLVVAGLDSTTPIHKARPYHFYRDRRVTPGDDGGWGGAHSSAADPCLRPHDRLNAGSAGAGA